MEQKRIRQPIVTVCGHVDHGKTSLLDRIRQSSVQKTEAGGITQKISFTLYPMEMLRNACPLIEKTGIKLDIPGFLFIDTPGHAAFTNLRKRGGSLADLAILVIDINEGIKPQTAEVIQILKYNKTPFIIALNKIDNISGWRNPKSRDVGLKENIESQPINIRQNFDEKYLTLVAALNSYNLDADLFYNISDFTKKIALIPCSARTGEGIQEIILMLCGLSQKYLQDRLKLGKRARGVVLEIKKEKEMNYMEAILYDGKLSKKDEIALADINGKAIITKIRVLEEIQPLSSKFTSREEVSAATGLRLQLIDKADILPGMPFIEYNNDKEEIEKTFKKEISENIKTDGHGIIAKADSLGSLEALLVLLRQSNIPVVKAGIGKISKTDVISAKANLEINEIDAVIAGFNVSIDEDAKPLLSSAIKVITDDVVYKLIENLSDFRAEKLREIEKNRLMQLASLCKIKILPQYVFRNTNPAIFGVRVEGGRLVQGINFIDSIGEKVGRIKNIQHEKNSVNEATEGMEVAVSMPGINFERRMKDVDSLYSDISETQFRNFKKNKDLLSQKEISVLQEIASIKRAENTEWGK
ncbi:MAG: translation initiation factor IF-2 [Candidatus Pacearchaeota archaeon]|nr:translation initiation factor IF-2 [Candidatus Pacearchaeota archaeon]